MQDRRVAAGIYNEIPVGTPVYRVADFLPPQGQWTEREFLWLDDDEGLIELVNGRLEFPPDLLCILNHNLGLAGEHYAETADLVVEVVSADRPNRDWIDKKAEYAAGGIPEYWIADPRDNTLTIFTLDAGATEYREAGRYKVGETATSVLLEGLVVDVAGVFRTDEADA